MSVAVPSPEPAEPPQVITLAPAARYRMVVALALYYCVPLWVAWYVYELSGAGLSATLGEATGALVIPGLIAVGVRKWVKGKSNVPFYVAVVIAAFGFLSGNQNAIADAIDAHAYQREMAGATTENYRDRLAHSQTRLGKSLFAAVQISESSGAKVIALLSPLDDDQLKDALTSQTLLDGKKRKQTKQLPKDKTVFAQATLVKIGSLYTEIRNDMDAKFTGVPVGFKRHFFIGFDESRPENERLIRSYVANYVDMYKHLLAMLDILDANDRRFTIRQGDGMVIFADNAAIAPYNQETEGLKRDAANIQQIQGRMNAARDTGIKKMIPQ
jgi:hypothetical protein